MGEPTSSLPYEVVLKYTQYCSAVAVDQRFSMISKEQNVTARLLAYRHRLQRVYEGLLSVHLEYVSYAEAARKAGIPSSTATDLRDRAGALCIERFEAGLPPPSYEEQVAIKPGSGPPVKLTVDAVTQLLEACTLNKKQRKKLWHIVAKEEGFIDLHCSIIEKKLRARGLRCTKQRSLL